MAPPESLGAGRNARKKGTTKTKKGKNGGKAGGKAGSTKGGARMADGRLVSDVYMKLTTREQALLRPDTYIGNVNRVRQWKDVWDEASQKIVRRKVCYPPALIKIFDEVVTNAADHYRSAGSGLTKIDVTIDAPNARIRVVNNGRSIPVVEHDEHEMYIPEMVFGHFLTSDKYEDDPSKQRLAGGRNGYGAKLAATFSTRFQIECRDGERGYTYKQILWNNLETIEKPVVRRTKATKKAWTPSSDQTAVTFDVDMARFGYAAGAGFDEDLISVLQRRVVDIGGVTPKDVTVRMLTLRGEKEEKKDAEAGSKKQEGETAAAAVGKQEEEDTETPGPDGGAGPDAAPKAKKEEEEEERKRPRLVRTPAQDFQKLVLLYEDTARADVVFFKLNEYWEIAIAPVAARPLEAADPAFEPLSPTQQVSFVNAICTPAGTHVKFVRAGVKRLLLKALRAAHQKKVQITAAAVEASTRVFINCLVDKPAFSEQTKENLTTLRKEFGTFPGAFAAGIPDAALKKAISKLCRGRLGDNVVIACSARDTAALQRVGAKGKRSRRVLVPKLDDANWAGTRRSAECTLILTEGDSAKGLAVAGLGVIGRDAFGVFPLKGKLLNVSQASRKRIMENQEIQNICAILGLQINGDMSKMRYGRVIIMADQDVDGSHIKSLIMNVFLQWWPALLQREDPFLLQFITPILKVWPRGGDLASNKATARMFFTEAAFDAWREELGPITAATYAVKYYKGLGTNTAAEAKQYFSSMGRHCIPFDNVDAAAGIAAFRMLLGGGKGAAAKRREWLARDYVPIVYAPGASISCAAFVEREMPAFSHASNRRAIPCVVDGLKPSQRKVLFGVFKRRFKKNDEIKVAQLAGYIAEHAAYHHGEVSLQETIKKMAQDFPGSNNVNLLFPSGMFGTRLQGGKDSASARYICTRPAAVLRLLFPVDDDALVPQQTDEGQVIEPVYFAPVIPLLLCNGVVGIGSGHSVTVPMFRPLDVLAQVRQLLAGRDLEAEHLTPAITGLRGSVAYVPKPAGSGKGASKGEKEGEGEEGEGAEAPPHSGCWVSHGCLTAEDGHRVIIISELPAGVWTETYLETHVKARMHDWQRHPNDATKTAAWIEDFTQQSTGTAVLLRLRMTDAGREACVAAAAADDGAVSNSSGSGCGSGLLRLFGLTTTIRTTNMKLYNDAGHIHKYETTGEVLRAWFGPRMVVYRKRLIALREQAEDDRALVSAKVAFITMVADNELDMRAPEEVVSEQLQARGLPQRSPNPATAPSYNYLLDMAIRSITARRLAALQAKKEKAELLVKELARTTAVQLWARDLDALEPALQQLEETRVAAATWKAPEGQGSKSKRAQKGKGKAKRRTGKGRGQGKAGRAPKRARR